MNSRADGYGTFRYTGVRFRDDIYTMKKPIKRNAAFEEARALKAPLADQLSHFAGSVSDLNPQLATAYQILIEKFTHAGTGAEAPKAGDRLPSFCCLIQTAVWYPWKIYWPTAR